MLSNTLQFRAKRSPNFLFVRISLKFSKKRRKKIELDYFPYFIYIKHIQI